MAWTYIEIRLWGVSNVIRKLEDFFPARLREPWKLCMASFSKLEEIRIRVRQPVLIRWNGMEYGLTIDGELIEAGKMDNKAPVIYGEKEVEDIFRYFCHDSVYAYEEERRKGFMTLEGGHRVGLAGEVVYTEGQGYILKYIRYINIRVAHEIQGIATYILPWISTPTGVYNTLIVSPPGIGKTTLLRDTIRMLSNGEGDEKGSTVGVVDERGEIAAAYRGTASLDCGYRTDVITGGTKQEGVMRLLRTFAPRVIAMDEIGLAEDAEAIRYAAISGCNVIATVHASSWEDLTYKKEINALLKERIFQRVIIMYRGDKEERYVQIYDGGGQALCGGK